MGKVIWFVFTNSSSWGFYLQEASEESGIQQSDLFHSFYFSFSFIIYVRVGEIKAKTMSIPYL